MRKRPPCVTSAYLVPTRLVFSCLGAALGGLAAQYEQSVASTLPNKRLRGIGEPNAPGYDPFHRATMASAAKSVTFGRTWQWTDETTSSL